jgi:heme a synthase
MTAAPSIPPGSRLLHGWALLTVLVTLVQLTLGAVVTTFRVGMADPVWPTAPWQLFLISWQEPSAGYLIEHTHRFAGHLVGVTVIVLAAALWYRVPGWGLRVAGWLAMVAMVVPLAMTFASRREEPEVLRTWLLVCLTACLASLLVLLAVAWRARDPRVWLGWFGTLALAGVIAQGLLGGFRVYLNALAGTDLAVVHGCVAQAFFALVVGLAVATGRGWPAALPAASAWLRRGALLLPGVVFAQVILGALLRHTHGLVWGRLHLLTAFAVAVVVALLAKGVLENGATERRVRRVVLVLAALVAVQVLLGVEAWALKFSAGTLPELVQVTVGQAAVRTAHVLAGAGVLAAATALALRMRKRASLAVTVPEAPAARLEGAA